MFRKIVSTSASRTPGAVRLALAAVFIAHGAGKVLGSWAGPGLAKFTSFPPPFTFMRPGWLWMGAAAFSELIGGSLLLLGLLTESARSCWPARCWLRSSGFTGLAASSRPGELVSGDFGWRSVWHS